MSALVGTSCGDPEGLSGMGLGVDDKKQGLGICYPPPLTTLGSGGPFPQIHLSNNE